ncbi:bifunctional metallophosphatase/5'-nucleotidase [Natrinema salifodinae]|uniref:2',3'-cyclic-nucleotide 2'-phosphodiesterase / 3'-nucleotidase n=1 Tax=Natrinema salifodinae TaxID=1202768 RepID=A0A1I0QL38_9EURY|nr:5'-nucleotidase C-terminal domain-containing protein [Natrinema salifodinae]SEW27970.1 2',3'-cyclic-nucleotide 2'-phosphodiesterase / 3'-nucleotidase [Natrinema salifodinae]
MPSEPADGIDRRRLLKGVGSASVAALAGCAFDDTSDLADGETDGSSGDDTDEPTTVRLLHDTHLHGSMGDLEESLNVANYFGLMADQAAAAPEGNALVVGNGDDLHTSVESSVFDGEHMVELLNASPLAYDTFGNHEFDNGPASLRENVADSEFTWVSANVRDDRTGEVFAAEEGAKRYALEEIDGVRFGITGLAPADTPDVTSVGEHVEVRDPETAAEAVVADLRDEGADVVLLLSHLASPVAADLVAAVDGIDVAVGDHAAMVYDEPKEIDDAVVSVVGDEFEYVGQLDLDVGSDGVTDHSFERYDLDAQVEAEDVDPHEDVRSLLADYQRELESELDVVIGETDVPLDARTETVRSEESNLGNWLADVVRADVDADVALQNGGGIRSDQLYEAGELTRRTIVDILPFPNRTAKLEVSGATLREAIERGVSAVAEGHGRFPQVSGMAYAYEPDAPAGDRVEAITVDGEPLADDATYELATNDFVASGGDGYEVLADADVLVPADEGTLLSALAIETIREEAVIAPETEGRIEIV